MKRTRTPLLSYATLCAVVTIAGCSSVALRTAVPRAAASPAITVSPEKSFPDGTYKTTATRAEAAAKGFTDAQITQLYGADGTLPITFKFVGGQWTQLAEYTPGVPEPGDGGTYRFINGALELTDHSSGCSPCSSLLDWTFNGSTLTLRYRDKPAHSWDMDLITEHTFTKVG
jgi:hypothetical protein